MSQTKHKAIPVLADFTHHKHFTWNDIRTFLKVCFKHFALTFANALKTAAAVRRKTSQASETEGPAFFRNDDPADISSQRVCSN